MPTSIRPPKRRLGKEPTIQSLKDLGTAFDELSYLSSLRKQIDAVAQQQIVEITNKADSEKTTKIANATIPINDREGELFGLVRDYCEKNRDSILLDGKKSREFTHGKVSWANSKPMLAEDAGKKPADVLAKLEEQTQHDLTLIATNALAKVLLTDYVDLSDMISVRLTINKQKILQLHKDKLITDDELQELYLSISQLEKMKIEVKEYIAQ